MPELAPYAYHFVDRANWSSVQRQGLLPASMLMRDGQFAPEVTGQVWVWRREGMTLPDRRYIRDQKPMPPKALMACLDDGLMPQDWYDLLNACIFFWLDPNRVERHRRALRWRSQVLLTLDALALSAAYARIAYVSPFNVGAAVRRPARRGHRTLVPIEQWRATGWTLEARPGARARSASHPPAELILKGAVPDIMAFVTAAEIIEATSR